MKRFEANVGEKPTFNFELNDWAPVSTEIDDTA